jgi:hypothetical protein
LVKVRRCDLIGEGISMGVGGFEVSKAHTIPLGSLTSFNLHLYKSTYVH